MKQKNTILDICYMHDFKIRDYYSPVICFNYWADDYLAGIYKFENKSFYGEPNNEIRHYLMDVGIIADNYYLLDEFYFG